MVRVEGNQAWSRSKLWCSPPVGSSKTLKGREMWKATHEPLRREGLDLVAGLAELLLLSLL